MEKALNKLRLPVLYTPLPGMEIALMPHQVIGVAWMLEKERGSEKGGCLADEMGLGKVCFIATCSYALINDVASLDRADDRNYCNESLP